MNIRKKTSACILVLAFSLIFTGIGVSFLRAGAEESADLLLPENKEEYLPLLHPSDAAFSEHVFAIADGSLLYTYDKSVGEYETYTHYGTTGELCEISSVAFTYDGKLFFSDSETHLYRYDLSKGTAEIMRDLPCSTFAISSDTLYFSAVATSGTTLYAVPHNNPSFENATKVDELSSGGVPRLFAEGGKLYCAIDSLVHIYERSDSGFSHTQQLLSGSDPVSGLKSICYFGEKLYYADDVGLHRTDGNQKETVLFENGIQSLSVSGSKLYVISSGVREAILGGDGSLTFTGYEIAEKSGSYNRLSGACDVVRGGDLLVCADSGNERVLIWNRATDEYSSLACGAAQAVATDGTLIAAAVQNTIYVYDTSRQEYLYTFEAPDKVKGVAVVLGKCYFATETSFWEAWEGGASRPSGISCTALTSDLWGNLYAVDAQGKITRYREEEFAHGGGTPLEFSLPANFRSLRADFEGNLYCLVGRDLYRNGAVFASAPEAFSGDEPISLALEEHEDAILYGYENYILRVRGKSVPVLDNISTANLQERIFSVPASGEITVLSVPQGLPGVLTDLSAVKTGASSFSCKEVRRTEGQTGILLGRTENYVVCALYENFSYSVYLLPSNRVSESEAIREEPQISAQFTLSETKLIGYPCLTEELERELLPRAFPVTVLNVLKFGGEAFDFAYVETSDGVRGYLPTNLLSDVEPTESDPKGYRIGYLKASGDGVVFRTDSGETTTVHERKKIRIYESENNLYMVTFEENGVTYSAQVTGAMIEDGSTNMIRISIIIVLCVVAVGLCAIYVILIRPKKKK